jgi:hypothetical protein
VAGPATPSEGRLDEPLSLAVGLRAIGPGKALLDAQLLASLVERLGSEHRSVVGQQPFDGHAQAVVVGHRIAKELHCAFLALVRVHGRERHAGVVIDGHKEEFPAGSVDRIAPVACHTVAGPLDATELLGVDVQQIARLAMLVALHRLARLQIRQFGQTRAAQRTADRCLRDADALGDAGLQHSPMAQLDGQQSLAWLDRAR